MEPKPAGRASVPSEVVASKMRSEYQHASIKSEVKQMESLQKIISDCHMQNTQLSNFLDAIAQFIYRQLNILSLSIGTLDSNDNRYHYRAFAGLRKQAEDCLKKVSFSKEDFLDLSKYPHSAISKYTKLFLAENNPYAPGEEESYNRPLMLTQQRSSSDDSIEGDYLDIMIMGSGNEILGWIEVSGTKQGKLPDALTIHWLELVGSIIGLILTCKNVKI